MENKEQIAYEIIDALNSAIDAAIQLDHNLFNDYAREKKHKAYDKLIENLMKLIS